MNEIGWKEIWEVFSDIIFPHSGRLIWSITLMVLVGVVLSVLMVVIYWKKGVFKRVPKIYNWLVKLYIPLIIVATVYLFFQVGLGRGFYKILKKENPHIASGIYAVTVDQLFENEKDKKEFFAWVRDGLIVFQQTGKEFTGALREEVMKYKTGSGVADKAKDRLTGFLMDRYGDDIFVAILYAALNKGGEQAGIEGLVSQENFHKAVGALLETNVADIEQSIKDGIAEKLGDIEYEYYNKYRKTHYLIWLALMFVPVTEFLIYKNWIEKRYATKIDLDRKDV